MNIVSRFLTGTLIAGFFFLGCSQVDSPIDSDFPVTSEVSSSDSHNLLGFYTFVCHPEAAEIDVIPIRGSELHLNVLKFLEPPPNMFLTLESPPEFNGNILDVDVGLRNPFSGLHIYTGFDVCGIVFTHGSVSGYHDPDIIMAGEGDTRLLNADGYTRWWNPAEFPHGNTIFNYVDGMLGTPADYADFNCTVNGYKYFADGLDANAPLAELDLASRGMFQAGQQNIRHYTIDLSGGLVFNYAVDANWKHPTGGPPYFPPDDFPPQANRPEAYNVVVTEVENTLYHEESTGTSGGDLLLQIDVWDRYGSDQNYVSAESLAGLPLKTSTFPIDSGLGYSTFELTFAGGDLIQNGEAELLITVQSEVAGYAGVLPGEPVCAYFTRTFNILAEPPYIPHGWVRTWGAGSDDLGLSTAVDGSGNIYVTGLFRDAIDFDPDPDGVEEYSSNGDMDIFLSKFDPVGDLLWVRTWGGSSADVGQGVAVDGFGDVYVVGHFLNTVDFDPGDETDDHSSLGAQDIFVSKFDAGGAFQWARTWGDWNDDLGYGVAADDLGNVYITGTFSDTVDFDPGPGVDEHTSSSSEFEEVFLSKFDPDGIFLWARTWGAGLWDVGEDVVVDIDDNIYIAGSFTSSVDFDPGPGVFTKSSNGDQDAFLSKFNPDGDFLWVNTWGGTGFDRSHGIDADSDGNTYVTGIFYSGNIDLDPGSGVSEFENNGIADAFLSKFNPGGTFLWAGTWGGSDVDYGNDVAADNVGNCLTTGHFYHTVDFDPGPGTDWHTSEGEEHDVFLSKIDPDGNLEWARIFGGIEDDDGYGVAVDDSSNIFLTGFFRDTVDFYPGDKVEEHTSNGDHDVFLMKLSPDGNW